MRVAVIGSRGLWVNDLEKYLPEETTEIVSGGARGVDSSARNYALRNGLKLTEYLPEYNKYGRGAPLKRNITIIENADLVLALTQGLGMLLLILTVLYAFLSIRMEGASILDFLRCAVFFLFLRQQYYEWREKKP